MATIEDRLVRDTVLARTVLAATAVGILAVALATDPGRPGQAALAAVATAAVVAWARWPWLPVPAVVAGVVVPLVAVGATGLRLEPALLLLVVAALLVGAASEPPSLAAAQAVALLLTPVAIVALQPNHVGGAWTTWLVAILMGLFAGTAYRRQGELLSELDRARRQLADRAVDDERRRIARDVHDLVGHALSVVLLQITSARHVLHRDLDAVDQALRTAEEVGRQGLHDVRRTERVLHAPATDAETAGPAGAPVPSASGIPALVGEARAAGLDVELVYDGDLTRIDGAVGLALHRITQESLANVARHAPDARTTVRLRVREGRAVLDVASVGLPARQRAERPGVGIIGMSERATTLGGALTAGPTPGGWRVHCSVPVAGRP